MNCARCGVAPGTRSVAAYDWCEPCWLAFAEPIIDRVITADDTQSVLMQDGVERPDHGPDMAMCRCSTCDATLVATPGDQCPYCEVAWERMVKWQAQKLTTPDLPDINDVRFTAAAQAWLDRLGVGVEAGIITEAQARSAWGRRVARVAA